MKVKNALKSLMYDTNVDVYPVTESKSLTELLSYTGKLGDMPYETFYAIKNMNTFEAIYIEDGYAKLGFELPEELDA